MIRTRKTHYRDYATEAFRFWAREGPIEHYRQKLWNEAMERQDKYLHIRGGVSSPSEAAVMRAQDALDNAKADIADLEAAEWAIGALERMRGRSAVKALNMVYLAEPDREMEPGEIAQRISKASVQIPAGERTIYYWLKLARDLFAEKRGLRM